MNDHNESYNSKVILYPAYQIGIQQFSNNAFNIGSFPRL